jgi:hypothetical protein
MYLAAWRSEIERTSGRATVNFLRVGGMEAKAKQKEEKQPLDEQQRREQIKSELDAFCAVDDESAPPSFKSVQQKYEWLLRENPCSPNLPESVNSMTKIVADAIWRMIACSRAGSGMPNAAARYFRIIEIMEDRIDRLEAEVAKACAAKPT